MSWVEDIPRRVELDGPARAAYPGLVFSRRQRRRAGPVYCYEAVVDVPGYEARQVRIEFPASSPRTPRIFSDGPHESPHRFTKKRLCIWYPDDDDDRRWVPEDGLLRLLGMIAMHLFKEAYWRETGEWLGDQVPHSTLGRQDHASEAGATESKVSVKMEADVADENDRVEIERQGGRRER